MNRTVSPHLVGPIAISAALGCDSRAGYPSCDRSPGGDAEVLSVTIERPRAMPTLATQNFLTRCGAPTFKSEFPHTGI